MAKNAEQIYSPDPRERAFSGGHSQRLSNALRWLLMAQWAGDNER